MTASTFRVWRITSLNKHKSGCVSCVDMFRLCWKDTVHGIWKLQCEHPVWGWKRGHPLFAFQNDSPEKWPLCVPTFWLESYNLCQVPSNSYCLHNSSRKVLHSLCPLNYLLFTSPPLLFFYSSSLFSPLLVYLAHSFSLRLPQLCSHTARADSFDLRALHVVEIWGLLCCQATGPVMERLCRRIKHCSWCTWWINRKEGKMVCRLLNTAFRVKGELHNLVVNPTPGSSRGKTTWESFADTGCRNVSRASCPVLVSWSVCLHCKIT